MNLIGYIIVCYLLIVNSYASVHIARHVWTWCNIIKQLFSTCYLTFFPFYAMWLYGKFILKQLDYSPSFSTSALRWPSARRKLVLVVKLLIILALRNSSKCGKDLSGTLSCATFLLLPRHFDVISDLLLFLVAHSFSRATLSGNCSRLGPRTSYIIYGTA